jgi:hypothetical protein
MTYEPVDHVVDRLIQALAGQVTSSADQVLAPSAVEALGQLSRAEANLIFAYAGHLVHYGWDMEPVAALIRLISDLQRTEAPTDATIVPGDEVCLVDEAEHDETVYIVRFVGDDATADVQPELWFDYIIETVPVADLKPARTRSASDD